MAVPAVQNTLSPAVVAALGTLAQHQVDTPAPTFGAFLKFNGKTGAYTLGDQALTYGTDMVADVTTFVHGWVAWPTDEMQRAGDTNGGLPLFKENKPMGEAVTPRADLPPFQMGVEPKYFLGCDFLLVPDRTRIVVQWDSKAGIEALLKLRDDIVAHAMSGFAEMEGSYPCVRIDESTYPHKIKTYGLIHKPKLTVIGWSFVL